MANTELIKKLRENTGCGMSDCNKALKETSDDYEKAVEWLRKKGLSSAAKKSSRVVSEGVVGISNNGNIATIIEVNSETDFVARNDKFQDFVFDVLEAAILITEKDDAKYIETLKTKKIGDASVADVLIQNIAVIGENIQIRRGKTYRQDNGYIASYIHSQVIDGLGKIGVLVNLESDGGKEKLQEFGEQLAMQIAASKPDFLSEADVPAARLESEKEIARELAKKSGKPDNIVEKMIEGRIRKFYDENTLLNQVFIMDENKKVKDLLVDFEKENGKAVKIVEYVLYVLGEGIEKQELDFAEEVASMVK
ncbi:MAG: translation elongation factor Ts [Rickettsiales bacterium]|jgi:elongation factor Ts|nr:translation elongation factor Ts [Rickettsiales bacterium]